MNAARAEPRTGRLRPMREADLAAVHALESRAYEFPWSLGTFRDCLHANYSCWVLQDDAQLIGYFLLSVAAGEAHVLNICVDPRLQGQGLGRVMMGNLLKLARQHRAERVFLEVRPSNPPAIHLYESLGFNEIGRRPRYYPSRDGREDAIVMAMELFSD